MSATSPEVSSSAASKLGGARKKTPRIKKDQNSFFVINPPNIISLYHKIKSKNLHQKFLDVREVREALAFGSARRRLD